MGKFGSGQKTGKGQFSFQSQRRAMPKIVQTTAKWHSLHMLARLCSKSSKVTSYVDVQAKFRKGRGTRDQIANIPWIIGNAREFQKNIFMLH